MNKHIQKLTFILFLGLSYASIPEAQAADVWCARNCENEYNTCLWSGTSGQCQQTRSMCLIGC